MNISVDGVTVRFKTEPEELFEAEKSGAKPNTVRILDAYEAGQIRRKPPTKIIIQHQQEIFLRTITNIHMTADFFGKVIAIFSWSNEIVRDPYAYTMGLDEQEPFPPLRYQAINVSLPLLKRLDAFRGEKTHDEVISKLLGFFYKPPSHQHTMPQNSEERDGFVAVTLSKQMHHTLQHRFSGRTINSVVQELYETYLYKLAVEEGLLRD